MNQDLMRQQLRQRARELVPVLRERAEQAAQMGRLPEETIADFHEAGFFRILQPARWQGLELEPKDFFEVQMILAEGCMSSAWVLGVVAIHNWQLALFDDRAAQDVWGQDTSVLISSSYMPVGKVERVEGGFRLSGRWGFSSGSKHCQWAFLGAMVPPAEPGGAPDYRTFLVPRADYQIIDNWNVMGLEATGSHDVLVEDAFVPEYRTHRAVDGFMQDSPGNAVNTSPLYRLPFGRSSCARCRRRPSAPCRGRWTTSSPTTRRGWRSMMVARCSRTRPRKAPWPTPWSVSTNAAPCCCATSS